MDTDNIFGEWERQMDEAGAKRDAEFAARLPEIQARLAAQAEADRRVLGGSWLATEAGR